MSDRRGAVSVQYVTATALAMVLLVLTANLLVDLYARAAVRHALTEGVRAATPVDADPESCERRARGALRDLLRGPIGDEVGLTCRVEVDRVVAVAHVRLASWLPLVPAWSFTERATSTRER